VEADPFRWADIGAPILRAWLPLPPVAWANLKAEAMIPDVGYDQNSGLHIIFRPRTITTKLSGQTQSEAAGLAIHWSALLYFLFVPYHFA